MKKLVKWLLKLVTRGHLVDGPCPMSQKVTDTSGRFGRKDCPECGRNIYYGKEGRLMNHMILSRNYPGIDR